MSRTGLGSFSKNPEFSDKRIFAVGIRLQNPDTGEYDVRLSAEIDGQNDEQAIAKLMAAFDDLPIGTKMFEKRGLGYQYNEKTRDGTWAKIDLSQAPAPSAALEDLSP